MKTSVEQSADSRPTWRWSRLRPEAGRAAQLRAMLAEGTCAHLVVSMEVLAVGEDGSALLWATDAHGVLPPRLRSARLSPARQAEALLALGQGLRPTLTTTFTVLGEDEDGSFGVVCDHPEGRLAVSAAPEPALDALIGR